MSLLATLAALGGLYVLLIDFARYEGVTVHTFPLKQAVAELFPHH